MNRKNGIMLGTLAGLVLAVTLMVTVSHTQSAPMLSGKFSLPFGAQWGKLSLQPGNYNFHVRAENGSYIISVDQNSHPLGFVLTTTFSEQDGAHVQDSALLCVRHDGSCSIGALKMPAGVFYFVLPSGVKAQFADEQKPDLIERVPVLFAQN